MSTDHAVLVAESEDTAFPKRALVIAPQPFFSPRGTPLSVYYRTLVTAEQGVEIDLLTYGEGQDVEIPGVNIIRIPEFFIPGPGQNRTFNLEAVSRSVSYLMDFGPSHFSTL